MTNVLRQWLNDSRSHSGWRWEAVFYIILALLLLVGCVRGQGDDGAMAGGSAQPVGPAGEAFVDGPQQRGVGERWIISAAEARSLIAEGATLLDARGKGAWSPGLGKGSFEGAIAITWQQFSEPEAPHRGNLLADSALLTEKLRAIGISQDRPVVVFADPSQGWGEAGRIVWMLRSLGHRQSLLVDGGAAALRAAGLTQGKATEQAEQPGDMVIARQSQWEIDQTTLKGELEAGLSQIERAAAIQMNAAQADAAQENQSPLVLLDTREPREFDGATPYGESRGGHLPGAVNLHFSQLLDEAGFLLPKAQIQARLAELGILPGSRIVAYCTGGIRSGWLTVVLRDLGYDVRNYAGSMWEWSAGLAQDYPLETSSN